MAALIISSNRSPSRSLIPIPFGCEFSSCSRSPPVKTAARQPATIHILRHTTSSQSHNLTPISHENKANHLRNVNVRAAVEKMDAGDTVTDAVGRDLSHDKVKGLPSGPPGAENDHFYPCKFEHFRHAF